MWPDFQPDARSLDTGLAPRRNTEGGIQPADKRLDQISALHLLLCAETSIKQIEASIVCEIAASGKLAQQYIAILNSRLIWRRRTGRVRFAKVPLSLGEDLFD
jgi:hypothetical protein